MDKAIGIWMILNETQKHKVANRKFVDNKLYLKNFKLS